MQDLAVTLIQCELAWEKPADNRSHLQSIIEKQAQAADLVVLPEMFTTGFSMNAVANAEPPGAETAMTMALAERQTHHNVCLGCHLTIGLGGCE